MPFGCPEPDPLTIACSCALTIASETSRTNVVSKNSSVTTEASSDSEIAQRSL